MMPDFPVAKRKLQKSQQAFFSAARKEHLGPFFGEIPQRILHEGQKMRQEYSKEMMHETDLEKLEVHFDLTISELKKNPFLIYEKWYEVAKQFSEQQAVTTIKAIDEVTALTGNVVDSRTGSTTDQFLQSLEKLQIDFDENGNPKLPTIVAGPETIKRILAAFDADHNKVDNEKRMEQIIEMKRKEWHDREINRKLVD